MRRDKPLTGTAILRLKIHRVNASVSFLQQEKSKDERSGKSGRDEWDEKRRNDFRT